MSKGYVYVLSNPSMPGLVKVGRSKHGGQWRANQMYQTGVAAPFILEFEIYVNNSSAIERFAHDALAQKRENAGREFFRCSVAEAVRWVSHFALACLDLSVINSEMYAAVEYTEFWGNAINKPAALVAQALPRIDPGIMEFAVNSFDEALAARRRNAN